MVPPFSRWSWLFLLVGCGPATPGAAPPQSLELAGIHNVWRLTPTVYSGSSPEGAVGFAALRDLGIRTIISVDGAPPEVALAEQHGLRYVHVPIGYDGVPRTKALLIARALRDLPGPVFVHCHHGKHRGPAAAVAACRCLDRSFTADLARSCLQNAGTAPHYRGLYADVERTGVASADEWATVPAEFPAVVAGNGWVQSMVQIDERWDQLQRLRSANWQPLADHPDLDPPHVALQLRELYRELARHSDTAEKPRTVRQLLNEAETAAGELETALRERNSSTIAAAVQRNQQLCKQCHAKARDNH